MLRLLALFFALIVLSTPTAAAADFDRAASWWGSLAEDVRLEIQGRLILTGDYDALVDGRFGPATFKALQEFEGDTSPVFADAMLTQYELARLPAGNSLHAGQVLQRRLVTCSPLVAMRGNYASALKVTNSRQAMGRAGAHRAYPRRV